MQNGRFQSESTVSNTQIETVPGNADLAPEDILDLEELQSLLTDFHQLTGIPIALLDLAGHVLIQRGWQEICVRFHRVNPVSRENCLESDMKLSSRAEPGRCLLCRCKNNMWDMASPICVEGKKMANLYMGQFFFDDENIDYRVFEKQAERYGFEKQEYMKALEKVPRFSREKIYTAMSFFAKLASALSEKGLANLKLTRTNKDNLQLLEKLATSEERFRSIFENTSIGFYRTSPEGKILIANPALLKMLGYSSMEALASRNLENHGFEPEYPRGHFKERMNAEGEITGFESAWTKNDGSRLFIRENARAVRAQDGSILYYEGSVEDITDHKEAEEALRKSEAKYRQLAENISDVVWTADLNLKTIYVSPSVKHLLGESVEEHLQRKMEEKFPKEYLAHLYDILQEEMKKEKQPDVEKNRTRLIELPHYRADGTIVWVSMNISGIRDEEGNLVGFQGVTRDISQRKRAEEKTRRVLQSTIEALAQTVERRDPYTAGHQRRVASLASEIAKKMGLSKTRVEGIHMAGFIHDIGKISVPADILNKPGRLNELEMKIIREHPLTGKEILRDVEAEIPLADIIYQHHERLDGSGYPQGLQVGEILLEARILGVADVVEAMASYRPYRPALGLDAAFAEIEGGKNILYDPDVVKSCLDLFRQEGYELDGR
jgi:PAS domain S-box-containing protein/putative nucleotidyltransferase with HDIG domain